VENVALRIKVLFSLNSYTIENKALLLQSGIKLKAQISEVSFWNLISDRKWPCTYHPSSLM
jgi:hypothetical protein